MVHQVMCIYIYICGYPTYRKHFRDSISSQFYVHFVHYPRDDRLNHKIAALFVVSILTFHYYIRRNRQSFQTFLSIYVSASVFIYIYIYSALWPSWIPTNRNEVTVTRAYLRIFRWIYGDLLRQFWGRRLKNYCVVMDTNNDNGRIDKRRQANEMMRGLYT